MSELKMSDVFELPLFAKNHEVGARCSIYEGRGVTVASSFYANQLQSYELICKAVNSHDRLTSENARLQSQLATITKQRDELVALFEGLERVTDIWLPSNVDNDHIGEAECLHRFRGEYLNLLSIIKEQKDAE